MADATDIAKLSDELQRETQLIQEKQTLLNQLQVEQQEAEKREKLAELEQVQADAKAFRIESSYAQSEKEKIILRNYAMTCEERANVLRGELGLVESEPETEPDEHEGHTQWLNRVIWGNLNISLAFLVAWFILYYVGEGETGGIGYVAQVLSKPAFHAFMLFAGLLFVFLVIRRYFYNVTEYLNERVQGASFTQDFQVVQPSYRLFFVVALFYVITQFLAAIYQITL